MTAMLNDTVRGGCDSPRGPHTHTHLLDFLSGFSVSSWPHRSCSGRPVSMTATHSQEPGNIWRDLVLPKGNLVAGCGLQNDGKVFGRRWEELAQNRCFPWDF